MEEIRCPVVIRSGKDDIQPDVERLPSVAHRHGVVGERIQLLDALEAVVHEEDLRGQRVAGVHALLDAAAKIVVLEGQAVRALAGLDHAVLAVPDLSPAACGVHGAVGHRAVQVVGEVQLQVVLGGGGVLIEAVRRVGPWHANLIGGDPVADGVVGVGIRVGGIHIR